MQNNMGDPRAAGKRNSERAGANKYSSLSSFSSPTGDQFFLPGMKSRGDGRGRADAGASFQNKTVNGLAADGARKRSNYGGKNDTAKQHSQEREQYYKFYLDSAQKAIEMMRKQHKSASIMKMSSEPTSANNLLHVQPGGAPGMLPQVSQSQYGMYPAKGDSFKNFDNMSNSNPGNSSLSPLGYADG